MFLFIGVIGGYEGVFVVVRMEDFVVLRISICYYCYLVLGIVG